jgi:hypothetical protein
MVLDCTVCSAAIEEGDPSTLIERDGESHRVCCLTCAEAFADLPSAMLSGGATGRTGGQARQPSAVPGRRRSRSG